MSKGQHIIPSKSNTANVYTVLTTGPLINVYKPHIQKYPPGAFYIFLLVFSNKFPYASLASLELVAILLPLPARSDLPDVTGSPLLLIFAVFSQLCPARQPRFAGP